MKVVPAVPWEGIIAYIWVGRRRCNASKVCERVSFINRNTAKLLSKITGDYREWNMVTYRMVVFPLAGAVSVLVLDSVPCQELAHLVQPLRLFSLLLRH